MVLSNIPTASLQRGKIPLKEYLDYYTKPSDGEAPVLEIW